MSNTSKITVTLSGSSKSDMAGLKSMIYLIAETLGLNIDVKEVTPLKG